MTTFTNAERHRYYGLRIGDLVEIKIWKELKLHAEVIEYGYLDNNRVILRLLDGSQAGEVCDWVAENLTITEKVEDRFPDWMFTIGNKVCKKTGKPFKSTFKENTVRGIINHPEINKPAFVFEEDDSYVECRRCLCV